MARKAALAVALTFVVSIAACARPKLVTTAPGAKGAVCLRNVRVFDARHAALAGGLHDVLVRDGRIAAVSAPGLQASGVPEIDCGGDVLLPGLIDLHVHSSAGYGPPWRLSTPRRDSRLLRSPVHRAGRANADRRT